MTQIKPKTTSEQIVATRCFCCCSLRPQQYRQTHSATPSRFTLPLKQPTDTSALSARFDRRFALLNGVFHVKHRFFYCFPVGILLFYCVFCLFFFASFCFIGLSGMFGQTVRCFYYFCGFAGMLFPIFVGRRSSFIFVVSGI